MSDVNDSHVSKKAKTTIGTTLFSQLDLSNQLTFDKTTLGASEIKHATIKYGGERFTFQLEHASRSLRCPFGLDDGSKFGGKPSLNIELPPEQLAFYRGLEGLVKDAAVANKESWFGSIKPPPSDEAIRDSFVSRVKADDAGKYPPTLKTNVNLSESPKRVAVLVARRLPNGQLTKPQPATVDVVARGARVVPMLRTAGGVWISVKKKTFEYGIVFEAFELVVIEEPDQTSSFNSGGVVVASDDEGDDANDAGEDGASDA